ncbi:MAG: hypothetical protein ACP5F6_07870 [Microbacter sp.]
MNFEKQERILVAPLNWGLGHAARSIPLIKKYRAEGHFIMLAANGEAFHLLSGQFPDLPFVSLPEWNIRYSRSSSQLFAMLWQFPLFLLHAVWEHRRLNKIIRQHAITVVISDNRFPLWNAKIKSIYLTHQLMIKMPPQMAFLEYWVWKLHRWVILKYDECWIPDTSGEDNLSGDLSHHFPLPPNARFIGWLSRFPVQSAFRPAKRYQRLCLVSGPEPHRTLFEQHLIARLSHEHQPVLLIRGKPSAYPAEDHIGSVDLLAHCSDEVLQQYILDTPLIICRSGYSTLMDLTVLGKTNVELVPTPGQTEQIYLAEHYHARKK